MPELGDAADVHVGDVDAGVAEQRADRADHAGAVVVGDHEHVVGGRHVEGVSSMLTMRCSLRVPASVPLIEWPPPRIVSRLT